MWEEFWVKSMPRKGILFSSGNRLTAEGYIDTDYADSLVDRAQQLVIYLSRRKSCVLEKQETWYSC